MNVNGLSWVNKEEWMSKEIIIELKCPHCGGKNIFDEKEKFSITHTYCIDCEIEIFKPQVGTLGKNDFKDWDYDVSEEVRKVYVQEAIKRHLGQGT